MSTISLTVSAGTDEGMCSEVSSAQIAAANPAAEAETFCDDSDHTFEIRDKEIPVNTLLEDIVQLVLEDEWSFGAGFWFLATQATGFHNQEDKLRSDNQDDFVDYMRDGVKANLTSSLNERLQWWQQANSFIMVS
ncbi:hypothetical protein LPJ59_000646 [Coemansia sp. RSA 2399]|nr:hypothetical protein LPJ59_000646 [Coemansia sp. RSA 2399]